MFYLIILIAGLSLFLFTNRRYRWFYIIYKTFKRDLRAVISYTRLNIKLWFLDRNNQTVAKVFSKLVAKHPNKAAFIFENQTWTFKEVEEFSNRVSHVFKQGGFAKGDVVALLLESRPEYVGLWLGLAKLGVVTALINNNLTGDPLIHSLQAAKAKALIYGRNYANAVEDISPKLSDVTLYQWSDASDEKAGKATNLADKLCGQPSYPLLDDIDGGSIRDKLIFIYTSGTTGMPKAAVITNMRFMLIALGIYYMTNLRDDDVIYDPLPLYHSAGGIVGTGQCLLSGLTVVVKRKFSASNFWNDCSKYKCTVAQYIGEICRYILAAAPRQGDAVQHTVRKIVGNGLRPQIWHQFVSQYGIAEVNEFYGATEGNTNLINIDSTVGAVGFVPRYGGHLYPVTLVHCDEATGEPVRDGRGFCTRCAPGEAGVFLGKIDPRKAVNAFSGYADAAATRSKIVQDVFRRGDMYFNSGDILVQDELGYYFFKDRTGDTFRWKGENVATTEVEAVISNLIGFKDAVAYGVEVPGAEGRAGMVSIVDVDGGLDLAELHRGLRAALPGYAVPIFVRVMESAPLTGTFKLKKVDLQKEGFDVHRVKDRLFVSDVKNNTYSPLTHDLYERIQQGNVKL